MQLTLKVNDEQLKAQRDEIRALQQTLMDREKLQKQFQIELDNDIRGKDDELNGLRLKIKEWSESLLVKDELLGQHRLQIQELKNKIMALEESKESLKNNCNQT